jgi:hypothetical protein
MVKDIFIEMTKDISMDAMIIQYKNPPRWE